MTPAPQTGFHLLRRKKMAKMASLHAEGLTDDDLETAEIAETLEEIFVD
jgi:hypothetical protein